MRDRLYKGWIRSQLKAASVKGEMYQSVARSTAMDGLWKTARAFVVIEIPVTQKTAPERPAVARALRACVDVSR